ncbi:hypothetical protein TELCIR_17305, partial [Teladorsagia circumcincta]
FLASTREHTSPPAVVVMCETSSDSRLLVERYFLMGVFGSGLALFGLLANGLLAILFLTRSNYRDRLCTAGIASIMRYQQLGGADGAWCQPISEGGVIPLFEKDKT